MSRWLHRTALALLAVTAGACGSTDGDVQGSANGSDADVAVGSTELGEVLVDADGRTLYLFTSDPEGESVCEGDCATSWPPATVEGGPVAGEGVDQALLATTERGDGSMQLTYDGAPLYRWAGDEEPGDVTGQGVGGVWYVVGPDGGSITSEGTDGGGEEPDDGGGDGSQDEETGSPDRGY